LNKQLAIIMDNLEIFSKDNIDTLPDKLKGVLGKQFIEEGIESYTIKGKKTLEIRQMEKRAHPLVKYWKPLLDSIEQTKSNGSLTLNKQSVYLVNLYFLLEYCKIVDGHHELLERLKEKNKFYSTVFELQVAEYYINIGMSVSTIKEGQRDKTPDFLVTTPSGNKIVVEAKYIEDKKSQEENQWHLFSESLDKIMVKHQKSLHIEVKAMSSIGKINLEAINSFVNEYCENNQHSSIETDDFQVKLQEICSWDYKFIGQAPAPYMQDGDIAKASYNVRRTFHSTEFTNARFINIKKYTLLDNNKALKNKLESANKQIKCYTVNNGELPSIIHIGLPHSKSRHIHEVAALAQNYLIGRVNNLFSKVNAIVVQGSSYHNESIRADTSSPQNPSAMHQYIVPNFNANNELPDDFKFNSMRTLNSDELEEGIAISFKYDYQGLIETVKKGLFGDLVYLTSRDGKSQVRVMITAKDKLRVQTICEKKGIINFDVPMDNRRIRTGNKISCTWKETELELVVDDIYSLTVIEDMGFDISV